MELAVLYGPLAWQRNQRSQEFLGPALQTLSGSEFEQRREIMQRKCVSSSSSFPWTHSLGQANTKWNTLCMLVISQCGKMCGNELNLVNSFLVMLGWVEPALSKNWLCLLVLSADNLCKQFGSRSDPNKTSDLCFPLWCPFARPFCASPITLFVYLYVYMTWNIYRNDAERGNFGVLPVPKTPLCLK